MPRLSRLSRENLLDHRAVAGRRPASRRLPATTGRGRFAGGLTAASMGTPTRQARGTREMYTVGRIERGVGDGGEPVWSRPGRPSQGRARERPIRGRPRRRAVIGNSTGRCLSRTPFCCASRSAGRCIHVSCDRHRHSIHTGRRSTTAWMATATRPSWRRGAPRQAIRPARNSAAGTASGRARTGGGRCASCRRKTDGRGRRQGTRATPSHAPSGCFEGRLLSHDSALSRQLHGKAFRGVEEPEKRPQVVHVMPPLPVGGAFP